MNEIERIIKEQSGVISRRQALGQGLNDPDIKPLLRRKDWALVHPGVYLTHTGSPTWQQRAWAAVLFSWPAALCHESALRAGAGPGRRDHDESVIHVAVDRPRNLVAPEGIRLHRMTGFGDRVLWNLGPPRVRYEQALLDLAADARTDLEALGVLADACGSRRTTAQRLLTVLEQPRRIARRTWLSSVLPTSPAAPARCWSTATWPGSSAHTGCREDDGRHRRSRLEGLSSETSSTRTSG